MSPTSPASSRSPQASVRRDLQLLESQQLLTRTHGGAVSSGVLYELPMRYRGGQRHDAKRAIAKYAVGLLGKDVSSVGLNGGSTTTEVARALAVAPVLRVVTNALNIAAELAVRTNIELVVCGGSARSESYELVGPLAELTLANINLDIAIIGVDGVSATAGLTTHHEVEAHTNRCLLRAAARVIVVADSSQDRPPRLRQDRRASAPLRHRHRRGGDADADVERARARRPQGAPTPSALSSRSGSSAPCAATMASASRQIASTSSVAEVFGSTISACRTCSGRPSVAARTVSSTTDRKLRLSAAHWAGSSPTATG